MKETRAIKLTENITLLFRPGSLWIGTHWSPYNRQWCVNLLPCITVRIKLKGL